MDVKINTLQAMPVNPNKPNSVAGDNLTEPKNVPARDKDGDSDNSSGQSSVNFSATALQLSSTSVAPGVGNQTQISNGQQARDILSQLVTNSQNNPEQLRKAFGNVTPAIVSRALA